VAIELHPFGLTTLGKVLLAQMAVPGASLEAVYGEAFEKLSQAIDLEESWSRSAIQPFMSLFSGTVRFLERRGVLTASQRNKLEVLTRLAEDRLGRDPQVREQVAVLRRTLRDSLQ